MDCRHLYTFKGVVEASCFRPFSEIQSRVTGQKLGTLTLELNTL